MNFSPNFIFVLGGLLLVAIGFSIGIVIFRNRVPDSVEKPVFEALMLVALALRTIFNESELEAIAGYVYDQGFASQYYTKEQFVELVKRVFGLLNTDVATAANASVPMTANSSMQNAIIQERNGINNDVPSVSKVTEVTNQPSNLSSATLKDATLTMTFED